MTNPTRILLVGCGRMNLSHVQGLKKLPELATIVAGVDPSETARKNIESEHNISPTFANLSDALNQVTADAAIIAVPNNLHADYTQACLKKGLHVLIEKPMALTLSDVDAMIATAETQNLLLMSGQSLRFANAIRYVKYLLDEKTIGNIRHIMHRRLGAGRGGDENSWFAKQALSGGILPGIGTHSLDVLLWWLNDKATTVSAIVKNIDPHPAIDIEDEVSLVAHTEKGIILNCALSFHHSAGVDWTVMGDKGVIHLNGNNGPLLINGKEHPIPESVTLAGEDQIHREFLTAIATKRPLLQASAQDVRKTMALIFAAMESGQTGQTVAVQ